MIYTLVTLTVPDVYTFLKEYSKLADVQYRAHGWQRSQVFEVVEHQNEVVLLTVWDDRAALEGFLKDPTVWQTLSGINTPKITVLKEIGAFSAREYQQ